MIPLAKPWFDGKEAKVAAEVINSGMLIQGPIVEKFEKAFAEKIGVKHAVAVNSGSSALLIAQQILKIGLGDEILVPDMTFVSTASSSMYLGARPEFVDINLTDYCIDIAQIEKHITPRTKAIIPVHYAGQSAEMLDILMLADAYDLYVIEDAAEAHLAKYQGECVGGIGDIGIFSFTPSKPMVTGEGGMITTNRVDLAQKARLVRNFYDVSKFEWSGLGFNFRMMDINAAIGLVQLQKLEKAIELRRRIAKTYTDEFSAVEGIIPPATPRDCIFQLYTIRLEGLSISRDTFI